MKPLAKYKGAYLRTPTGQLIVAANKDECCECGDWGWECVSATECVPSPFGIWEREEDCLNTAPVECDGPCTSLYIRRSYKPTPRPNAITLKYTITIPSRYSLPVKIWGSGQADDRIRINGQIGFMTGNLDRWERTWTQNERTFTIATDDTIGSQCGYIGTFYFSNNLSQVLPPTGCNQVTVVDEAFVGPNRPDPIGPVRSLRSTSVQPADCESDPDGPGTLLSESLALIGIVSDANCGCRKKAKRMNCLGPDGCEAHMDEILAGLREEAENRGLPFSELVARMMVNRAIKLSRRRKAKSKA